MTDKLFTKLRVVRCPKCRLLLEEPGQCDLYKCGACSTTLLAKRRRGVAVNSKSSIQESDAAPGNALDHVSERNLIPSWQDRLKELAYLRKNMILMYHQILRWLMQPKVWRFLCFASSVIGVLCYALSSSFNELLGKWTWWKILLYIVFSFIIGLTFLFTPARQRSNSPQLEAHLAFLVLIITSIYSFFFDKVVHGKPDAYGLISCGAFAITLLGWSRFTQCGFGFKIDVLYFFCGSLIVQLMKIKLWLVIVGGSFSYSLVILRSSLDTPAEHLQVQVQHRNQVIQVDADSEQVDTLGECFKNLVDQEIHSSCDSDAEVNVGSARASAIRVD